MGYLLKCLLIALFFRFPVDKFLIVVLESLYVDIIASPSLVDHCVKPNLQQLLYSCLPKFCSLNAQDEVYGASCVVGDNSLRVLIFTCLFPLAQMSLEDAPAEYVLRNEEDIHSVFSRRCPHGGRSELECPTQGESKSLMTAISQSPVFDACLLVFYQSARSTLIPEYIRLGRQVCG